MTAPNGGWTAQTPSVSRDVHYVAHGTPIRPDGSQAYPSVCRAAKVTEVDPDDPTRVGLFVMNPSGVFFHSLADGGCVWDETDHAGGTWHWPERV